MDISTMPLSVYTSLAAMLPVAGMRYNNTLSVEQAEFRADNNE